MVKLKVLLAALVLSFVITPAVFADADGGVTVTSSGTPVSVSGSSVPFWWGWFCGDSANTGTIILGVSPVKTDGAQEGITLSAGQCKPLVVDTRVQPRLDLANLKADATDNNQRLTYYVSQ